VKATRADLQREARVLPAEGRISARVLGALPVLLILACQVMNPDYLSPLFHGRGVIVLGACAGSVAAGIAWILHMVDVEDNR
jgi:tight adherence protein B